MTKPNKQKGFALLMAVIVTSTLLLISFSLSDISFKELILSSAGRDSQIAFYAADSGVECAMFWDVRNPLGSNGASAFSTSTAHIINCSGRSIFTDSVPNVPTVPTETPTVVGGSFASTPPDVSIFVIDLDILPLDGLFNGPCAIVRVKKEQWVNGFGATTITSRGYNTCDRNSSTRLERQRIETY